MSIVQSSEMLINAHLYPHIIYRLINYIMWCKNYFKCWCSFTAVQSIQHTSLIINMNSGLTVPLYFLLIDFYGTQRHFNHCKILKL